MAGSSCGCRPQANVPPGTPFPPDLPIAELDPGQLLDPDWLRIGTDIVGGTPAPTFNAAFSLTGIHPRALVARAARNGALGDGPGGIAATPPVLTAA